MQSKSSIDETIDNAVNTNEKSRGVSLKSEEALNLMIGTPSVAGIQVTQESSLTYSAVYACVSIIANSLATVPNNIYERREEGKFLAHNHPAFKLLKSSPNERYTAVNFRKTLFLYALISGNGYARIYRNKLGKVLSLELRSSREINPFQDEEGVLWYWDFAKSELVLNEDMIHLAAMGFNGIVGKSPIALAREAISLGMAANKFGTKFYENGAFLSGYLKHPGKFNEDGANRLRRSMRALYQGVDNIGEVGIFEEGMEFVRLEMALKDAQFLESRKFQLEEVCRWYHVPLHKINALDKATNNNIEHQSIEFVEDCLRPWAVSYEQEFDKKIFYFDNDKYFNKLELNGLLRGDVKTRTEFYSKLLDLGIFSINDVRQLEDKNPIPGGDNHLVQVNRIPIEYAKQYGEKLVKERTNENTT